MATPNHREVTSLLSRLAQSSIVEEEEETEEPADGAARD